MSPTYLDGDILLSARFWFPWQLRRGVTVIFHHPEFGVMVKSVLRVERANQVFYAIGAHPASTTTEQIGAISFDQVIGFPLKRFTPHR